MFYLIAVCLVFVVLFVVYAVRVDYADVASGAMISAYVFAMVGSVVGLTIPVILHYAPMAVFGLEDYMGFGFATVLLFSVSLILIQCERA